MSSEVCGVGIDCEQIERFRGLNDGFFAKNFTEGEREYCSRRPDSIASLAGRFACKEAVIKAFGSAGESISLPDIEIVSNNGVPEARLTRSGLEGYKVRVSISHSGGMALASAIVTKGG
jgi:fatty acid synthase subunit alpha